MDDLKCREIGPGLFRDVKEWLQKMWHFDEPKDATICALFVFQTRCYKLLPTVFYLFVMGPPGSGKTCLLNALAMLSRGVLLGNISVAAMVREVGRGREVKLQSMDRLLRSDVLYDLACFDEYDAKGNDDRHAAMDEMLRHGYRLDGASYVRWDIEKNKSKAWNLYMPKAAAATSTLEPALASRGFRISAAPYGGRDGYDILLNSRYPKDVKSLVGRLDEWADFVKGEYGTEGRIEELEKSDALTEQVETLIGHLGLDRRNEHALTCATICEMIGVEISEELKHGIETLTLANEEDEEEAEEFCTALLAVAERDTQIEAASCVTVKQSAVLKAINEAREAKRMRPLGARRFASIYRAQGIRGPMIRNRGGRNYWVIPMAHLKKVKGLVNLAHSPNLDDNLDQETLKVGQVDHVDLPLEDLEARVAKACEMSRQGRSEDEIERAVGPGVVNHCREKGSLPVIGGRQ